MIDSQAERIDARVNRRMVVGAAAAIVAGLSRGLPKLGLAATNPIDAPGAVARIAAPFAKSGFNGGLGGLFYTPLGGTLVGGLTEDEGGAIETGFRAGFYLPLFESNPKGASGKGYDAFLFINGLLFDATSHALAAGQALLDLNKPKTAKIATEKLANGTDYASYEWTGHVPDFDAEANVHRAVATAGRVLFIIDWEDFTKAQTSAQIADLKTGVSTAIDASRTGVPLAEAVTRINSTEQVAFDVLKCNGVEINGQSSSDEENKALAGFAKNALDFVRSNGSLELISNGRRFTIASEELVFDSTDKAKSFYADRRKLLKTIDAALGRRRVKGEPEAGIEGVDETTGDFYTLDRPDGTVLGADVTVRKDARVISMAVVNAGQTLPEGTTVTDASGDALAEVAALATSVIQALKLGSAGDALYDAGFGRTVESGAL
jgi:hypothetical protein